MNLKACLGIIPGASQTYSKGYKQFPGGPYFLTSGRGSHVKDQNGKEYIDFIMGLGAISLGYRDKATEQAICLQAINGITFSLPTSIEYELAKKIKKHFPHMERIRFAKNGSDVTSASIRLARAYTRREHIAYCGYHGSQDWAIANSTMNGGIPQDTKGLSHAFEYNNVSSLQTLFQNYSIACVIMEPMNRVFPNTLFLEEVRELCDENKALLIFDEVVTGFRLGLGGASRMFGVIPDMTCLGKGIANGMPLSVLGGRSDVMRMLEDDVFMSSTFGGETLSIASAIATIEQMERGKVFQHMTSLGNYIISSVKSIIEENKIDYLTISGHPHWSFLNFSDDEKLTIFKRMVIERGILIHNTHNLSMAHTRRDVNRLLEVYDTVLPKVKKAKLRCQKISPIFQIR